MLVVIKWSFVVPLIVFAIIGGYSFVLRFMMIDAKKNSPLSLIGFIFPCAIYVLLFSLFGALQILSPKSFFESEGPMRSVAGDWKESRSHAFVATAIFLFVWGVFFYFIKHYTKLL
jgi:hypothetical protein